MVKGYVKKLFSSSDIKKELSYTTSIIKEENKKGKSLVSSLLVSIPFIIGGLVAGYYLWKRKEEEKYIDSDNDGLTDSEEIRLGTNPLSKDSDNDGLTDSEEIRLGTNPLSKDSDNDGLTDSEEIRLGLDALKPNPIYNYLLKRNATEYYSLFKEIDGEIDENKRELIFQFLSLPKNLREDGRIISIIKEIVKDGKVSEEEVNLFKDIDNDTIDNLTEIKLGIDIFKRDDTVAYALKRLQEEEALKFKDVIFDENSKTLINLLASLPLYIRSSKELQNFFDDILSDKKVTELEKNLFDDKFVGKTLPNIENFEWKPTKVINDKIYDILITFKVKDDKTPISYAEIRFVPVRYDYFITKYGMRPEDYDKVFPPENERIYVLKPIDGNFDELEEEFEIPIQDIIGGKEYKIIVITKDLAENIKTFEIKTPYIRQYENFGKVLLEKGIIVAASYMSSYQPFKEKLDDYPILGKYTMPPDGPIDDIVLWKHVDWAGYAGINVFFIDAGAWEKWKLEGYEGEIMKKLMDNGIKCAFMWYAWLGDDRYFVRGTNKDAPEWAIDLTYPKNKENFEKQLINILNSNLINHPNYFRIDERPVIFIYDATVFINETEAWDNVLSSVSVKTYILGDIVHAIVDPYEMNNYFYSKWKDLSKYDAISSWVGFVGNEANNPEYNSNPNYWFKLMNELWYKFSLEISKQYVASIFPGFKRYYENVGIPRNLEEFKERILDSLRYTKFLRIDTWNDFAEGTFIEPSQKDGFNYIEILRKILYEYVNQELK